MSHGHNTDFSKLAKLCPVKEFSFTSTPVWSNFSVKTWKNVVVLPGFCFYKILGIFVCPRLRDVLEFHWSKLWSVAHPNLSRMESLMFFQTLKPLDDVCVISLDNHHPNKFGLQ